MRIKHKMRAVGLATKDLIPHQKSTYMLALHEHEALIAALSRGRTAALSAALGHTALAMESTERPLDKQQTAKSIHAGRQVEFDQDTLIAQQCWAACRPHAACFSSWQRTTVIQCRFAVITTGYRPGAGGRAPIMLGGGGIIIGAGGSC